MKYAGHDLIRRLEEAMDAARLREQAHTRRRLVDETPRAPRGPIVRRVAAPAEDPRLRGESGPRSPGDGRGAGFRGRPIVRRAQQRGDAGEDSSR